MSKKPPFAVQYRNYFQNSKADEPESCGLSKVVRGSDSVHNGVAASASFLEDEKAKAAAIIAEANAKAQEIVRLATEDAQRTVCTANERANGIISEANTRAEQILERARLEADNRISEMRSRLASDEAQSRAEGIDVERKALECGIAEIRSVLHAANGLLSELEHSVNDRIVKRVSRSLLSLYNLIADTRDSAFEIARKSDNTDMENMAYNLDVFLEMTAMSLADVGVRTIATSPGAPFSGSEHTVINSDSFDPRTATVKISRRCGFALGEDVIMKEKVEV